MIALLRHQMHETMLAWAGWSIDGLVGATEPCQVCGDEAMGQ